MKNEMVIEKIEKIRDKTYLTHSEHEALNMAIDAIEKQIHLERDIYDEVYMKDYYPTDVPEDLKDYHLFVPYKVVENFID